jgi:DNA polymerase III alpha subunit
MPCGCSFKRKADNPDLLEEIDYNNLPDCKGVWDMIKKGFVKGVFQLESNLGKTWAEKVKPDNLNDLAALGALLRPGTLNSFDKEGVSMTQHYASRKNGAEEVEKINDVVDEILKDTFNILIFQEQSILLSIKLAGFTPVKADLLRRGIGKKDAAILSQLKNEFVDGCKKEGVVSEELAIKIFDNIKSGERYSFNKCISPTTITETENGEFKTIDQLQIGEIIKSPFGPTKVLNKYENGIKFVYNLVLESGENLICTEDHKVLCEDGVNRPVYELNGLHKVITKTNKSQRAKLLYPLGNQRVVDIEVDNHEHVFYGNGIATSNSHAYGYGVIGYQTAYAKYHFPVQFFTAWIAWAKEKMDQEKEMNDLIMEAKLFNIGVFPPKFEDFRYDTYNNNTDVFLGLTEIKGIGTKVLDKMKSKLEEFKLNLNNLTMDEIIVCSPLFTGESAMEKLINSGAFSKWSKDRKRNIDKLSKFYQLTNGEQEWCLNFIKENKGRNLIDILLPCSKKKKEGGGCHNDKRVKTLNDLVEKIKNPSSNLDDTQFYIYNSEVNSFGVPLTISKVDTVNSYEVSQTCKDFIIGQGKEYILSVEIVDFRVNKIKRGQSVGREMASLSITDGSAKLDNVLIFADQYDSYKNLIDKGNIVVIRGYKDEKKGNKMLVVKEIYKGEK